MIAHYQDYYWKNGKPYGRHVIDPLSLVTYRVIVDPYYKRFSVEKYQSGKFDELIYDSLLLDFRHLTPQHQMAWQKELLAEEESETTYLLKNQDDRAVYIERNIFKNSRCHACILYSIHGLFLSIHRIYYQDWDNFNGVVLFDREQRPVMQKSYALNAGSDSFTTLLSEQWDMREGFFPSLSPLSVSSFLDLNLHLNHN